MEIKENLKETKKRYEYNNIKLMSIITNLFNISISNCNIKNITKIIIDTIILLSCIVLAFLMWIEKSNSIFIKTKLLNILRSPGNQYIKYIKMIGNRYRNAFFGIKKN